VTVWQSVAAAMQGDPDQVLGAEDSGQLIILAAETDLAGAVELESLITGKLAAGTKAGDQKRPAGARTGGAGEGKR